MTSKNRFGARESFWRSAFEKFWASGLSVRAFCEREGLSQPSFYSWRRKLQQRDAAATGLSSELVEMRVVDPEARGAPARRSDFLELVTPEGFILRFPAAIEPRQLDGLLNVVTQRREARC